MEDIVERALAVVKSKSEWVNFIKQFDDSSGFIFVDSAMMDEIKDAVDAENPIHSGASLALCLQKCKILLNNT